MKRTGRTGNAFWQVATIARDDNLHIKAAHNFLRAAQAYKDADDQVLRRNVELAAQFESVALERSFPHDDAVTGAVFTGDEARVLSWSRDGAVKLWDVALNDEDLTPAERILDLEVRSATRLGVSGQLTKLSSAEWTALVRSDEYAAMQKKKSSNGPGPSK